MRQLAVLVMFLAVSTVPSQASIVYFGTGVPEVSETNSLTGTNVPIPPVGWGAIADSVWEGTGAFPTSPVTFSFMLDVPDPISGWVGVLSTGPAKVMFDGWLITDGGVGSSTPSWYVLPWINHGLNALTVTLSGGEYTLDVYGAVTAVCVTPEPVPAVIVGLGLLALGLMRGRKTNG